MWEIIILVVVVLIVLRWLLQFKDYTYSFEQIIHADFKDVCDFRADLREIVQVHPLVYVLVRINVSTFFKINVCTVKYFSALY